jgi:hypothetical protein
MKLKGTGFSTFSCFQGIKISQAVILTVNNISKQHIINQKKI